MTTSAALLAPATDPLLAEAMFLSLFEAAPDAMVIANREGNVVAVNTRAEELFGYRRDELVGQRVEMLLTERQRTPTSQRSLNPFGRQQTNIDVTDVFDVTGVVELRGRRKNGSEFLMEIASSIWNTARGPLQSSAIRRVRDRKAADEVRFRLAAIVESSDDATEPDSTWHMPTNCFELFSVYIPSRNFPEPESAS